MKAAIVAAALLLASQGASAAICFYKGERTSGMNKICFYDCLGSAAAITISAVALCPLNINQKAQDGGLQLAARSLPFTLRRPA